MTEDVLALSPEVVGNMGRHALYRFYSDNGELLYVGTSGDFGRRFPAHAQKIWFLQVRGITLEWYATEDDARSNPMTDDDRTEGWGVIRPGDRRAHYYRDTGGS